MRLASHEFSPMPHEIPAERTTEDAVLGGKLYLRQPRRGHRVGHDAILLAAATGARAGQHAVDLGAGVGAAGLALARRVHNLRLTLVEIDPALVALARDNIRRNGLGEFVRAVVLDVAAPARAFAAERLPTGCASCVLMNPPFNNPLNHKVSPHAGRRLAHAARPAGLATWVMAASRLLGVRGVLTLIWRADGLAEVLRTISPVFGGITVLPVHPRPAAAAIRILVRAAKGSQAPFALMPGLVLADEHSHPTNEANAILRQGKVLPLAEA
jgi:tRNA1(Val) A37 N6-methylase TrmN6